MMVTDFFPQLFESKMKMCAQKVLIPTKISFERKRNLKKSDENGSIVKTENRKRIRDRLQKLWLTTGFNVEKSA